MKLADPSPALEEEARKTVVLGKRRLPRRWVGEGGGKGRRKRRLRAVGKMGEGEGEGEIGGERAAKEPIQYLGSEEEDGIGEEHRSDRERGGFGVLRFSRNFHIDPSILYIS